MLNKIYEELNELVRNEEVKHSEVIRMFVDFLGDSLCLKVELGFTDAEIRKLETAGRALMKCKNINPREVK